MCGRFVLASSMDVVSQQFGAQTSVEWSPNFNIAPSQPVVTICAGTNHEPQLLLMKWGFIPHWAKANSYQSTQWINARCETAAEKPAFRQAMAHRRCLIIADGFFEWHTNGGIKQPYYIQATNHQSFAIAGIWERWIQPDGQSFLGCAMLTTTAIAPVSSIHARMPVIVAPASITSWLDPLKQDSHDALAVLVSSAEPMLSLYPVTTEMNNPHFNSPACIDPISL